MLTFTFTGRDQTTGQRVADFAVSAADRFEAFDTARSLRPELSDLGLVRGDGLCPGCNGDGILTDDPQVKRCRSCGGVFTDRRMPVTFEQAMKFVALHLDMLPTAGAEGQFYFDLDICTNWKGQACVARIHGWADTKTRRVVQFG
jgi:hypothetical protein